MKVTVEFDWNKHTSGSSRAFLLRHAKLPRGFVEEIWDSLHYTQQRCALLHQKVSRRFVEKKWRTMNSNLGPYCVQYGKVSLPFIERNWSSFENATTMACITYMELTMKFIMKIWSGLSPEEKGYCWRKQTLRNKLTKEQLPIFLADAHGWVAQQASERLEELEEVTKDDED